LSYRVGRYPSKILQSAEGILDEMAILVPGFVISDLSFPVGSAGNDRNGFLGSKALAKCTGIITLSERLSRCLPDRGQQDTFAHADQRSYWVLSLGLSAGLSI